MEKPDYDVIEAEIHRKALTNLTNEMSIALRRTSGSPVVTEVMDFSTCVFDLVPEHLSFAAFVLFHSATSLVATQAISSLHKENVKPGDGWIINDPRTGGAAHQGDVAIVMPAFYGDQHLGWTFTNMHLLDMGGMGVSSFAPGAHEVYEEGLLFPPTKIVTNGAIDPEWERFIGANVRVPGPVLNDIRSMVSANNVGNRKLNQIVAEFGVEKHFKYANINKDLSEQVMRQRIQKIPDGIYQTRDWNEFDGHDGPDLLLEMNLELEVKDSDLFFKFSGVPQVDAFVNSAYGAMLGQTLTSVLTTLVYGDLPVNGGVWRPVHLDIGPEGTIVNSVPPAPVTNAHSEVGMRAAKMTKDVLSQALSFSDDPVLRSHVAGQAQDGWAGFGLYGLNQKQKPTVIFMNNTSVGIGGGAQSIHDGQDSYGCTCMSGCGLSDVESGESSDPILYLWRKIIPNSGGPGLFRGGQGLEEAIVVRGTDFLAGPGFNAVSQVPPRGFGGGYPAASCRIHPIRNSNVSELFDKNIYPTEENLTGNTESIRQKVGRLGFNENDVLIFGGGGGGGVGDPLLRDPQVVWKDIDNGFITQTHAEKVYGVVLGFEGTIDAEKTKNVRQKMRSDRLSGNTPEKSGQPSSVGVAVKIEVSGKDRNWACSSCDHNLGDQKSNWREHATNKEKLIVDFFDDHQMYVRRRNQTPEVVIREYFCPSCAAALTVDVGIFGEEGLPAAHVF